jgi:hypothetical protein|nr:MAG TPA: tail completion protein [Caudoviricetes sp.]
MIPSIDIRNALSDLLKRHFPYTIYFTNNANAKQGYFHIKIAPKKRMVDRVIYERSLDVEIQLVLPPDTRGRIDRAKLYEVVDTLDAALLPVLTLGDRHITVQETSSRIVDEVLHYSFTLDFADAMPGEEYELMEELSINGQREQTACK